MNDHDKPGMVKSDETLFSIIEQLKAKDGAGVTELASELNLAKSAIHKHLQTMVQHGFAVKQDEQYHLGFQFLNLGEYKRNRYSVYHAAKSSIDELAQETGEMAWLIIEENGLGMYLYGDCGQTEVRVESLLGSWTQLHNNSAGKAILAHLSRERVNTIIDQHGLPRVTENTITDRDALFEELEAIHEQGYAINRGEDIEGIRAIGAPITFEGKIHGALSLAGAAGRLTQDGREQALVDRLLTAADDVEVNLAFQ